MDRITTTAMKSEPLERKVSTVQKMEMDSPSLEYNQATTSQQQNIVIKKRHDQNTIRLSYFFTNNFT